MKPSPDEDMSVSVIGASDICLGADKWVLSQVCMCKGRDMGELVGDVCEKSWVELGWCGSRQRLGFIGPSIASHGDMVAKLAGDADRVVIVADVERA